MKTEIYFYFDGEVLLSSEESFEKARSALRPANSGLIPALLMQQLPEYEKIISVENWKVKSQSKAFDHLDHRDVFQGYLIVSKNL
jgi:hypothetical protein